MSRGRWRLAIGMLLVVATLMPVPSAGASGPEPPSPAATLVRVDNGTSVTIYERTTNLYTLTYPVTTLTTTGATWGPSPAFEYYTFTSDGAYLTIHCFRDSWDTGTRAGNNIAGVRLDGVPGFPTGIWASMIVSYTMGYGGIESSRFNALYDDLSTITYMGDQNSELVLGFSVNTTNSPPTLLSLTATTADEGDATVFNAAATDPEGDPLTYQFDFEGDGAWDVTGSANWATHSFGDDFAGTAVVLVTDAQLSDQMSTSVIVTNVAPTVALFPNDVGVEGSAMTFRAAVRDPGSDDLVVTWSGACAGWSVPATYPNDVARFPDPTPSPDVHPRDVTDSQSAMCGDDGAFQVQVRAEDDDGGVTTVTVQFTADNAPPAIAMAPPSMLRVVEGTVVSVQANASDPGSDDLQFVWAWRLEPPILRTYHNDGVGPDPPASPGGTFPFAASDRVAHTYGDDCVCLLELLVSDDEGAWVGYNTTIEVVNAPPRVVGEIVVSASRDPVRVGDLLRLQATAADPGSDDLTFAWSWGDGSPDAVATVFNNGQSADPLQSPDVHPVEASDAGTHAFTTPGVHLVTLEVRDDDGGFVVVLVPVTVAAAPIESPVELNVKPLLASVFLAVLAVVGWWSTRRHPWRRTWTPAAKGKAFAIVTLPFVAAEAVTGVVSHTTGLLSIPPVFGLGLAVDAGIFTAGLALATVWGLLRPPSAAVL